MKHEKRDGVSRYLLVVIGLVASGIAIFNLRNGSTFVTDSLPPSPPLPTASSENTVTSLEPLLPSPPWWKFWQGPSERVLASATVFLAVATIILAVIAAIQAYIFATTDASTRMAAEAAQSAASTAKAALASSVQTFRQEERAWISPVAVGLTEPLQKGKPISIGLLYDNVGKLPATDLHEHYLLHVFLNQDIDDGSATKTIDETDVCRDIEPWKDAEVAYPQSGGTRMIIGINPTDLKTGQPVPLYESMLSGNHTLVIQFCIAYRTIGETDKSAFCYLYRPGLTNGLDLNKCDKGNKVYGP